MIQLTEPLHHAYGVSPNGAAAVPEILRALEKSAGFVAKGNPDFRLDQYEVMGIDEARALKEAAERTAITGGKKIFIVAARRITQEAQNALLKMLEEPSADTHFFLIVPSPEILLPTVRSRLFIVRAAASMLAADASVAAHFLAVPIPARLALVQEMLKELENERKEKEDRTVPLLAKGRIMRFLDALERSAAPVRELKTQIYADTAMMQTLSEVLKVRKYADDRAPSFKLLLEHLALVMPQR